MKMKIILGAVFMLAIGLDARGQKFAPADKQLANEIKKMWHPKGCEPTATTASCEQTRLNTLKSPSLFLSEAEVKTFNYCVDAILTVNNWNTCITVFRKYQTAYTKTLDDESIPTPKQQPGQKKAAAQDTWPRVLIESGDVSKASLTFVTYVTTEAKEKLTDIVMVDSTKEAEYVVWIRVDEDAMVSQPEYCALLTGRLPDETGEHYRSRLTEGQRVRLDKLRKDRNAYDKCEPLEYGVYAHVLTRANPRQCYACASETMWVSPSGATLHEFNGTTGLQIKRSSDWKVSMQSGASRLVDEMKSWTKK